MNNKIMRQSGMSMLRKATSNLAKKVKNNYGYFKAGVSEENKEYERMQKIKNTPEVYRTKGEQLYADMTNKTKRKKKPY